MVAEQHGIEQDPGKIRAAGRADDEILAIATRELDAAEFDLQFGQAAAFEEGRDAAADRADDSAGPEAVDADAEIEDRACRSAGEGSCGGELGAVEAPLALGFISGEIQAFVEGGIVVGLEEMMTVELEQGGNAVLLDGGELPEIPIAHLRLFSLQA